MASSSISAFFRFDISSRYIGPSMRHGRTHCKAAQLAPFPGGGATLKGVTFGPQSMRARGVGQTARPGEVDYRLVRKHTLDEFHRGRLGKLDVCDAHPE